jgi:hypothetical protein
MRTLRVVLVFAAHVALVSCMGTPTLPAPPPNRAQFDALEPPDADGFVTVTAAAGAFPEWDMEANRVYGIVVNTRTHRGVIEPVDNDGSFSALIEAEGGDVLNIRTRFSDGTESIPIELAVPLP